LAEDRVQSLNELWRLHKAHPIQNRGLFTKKDFTVDLAAMTATCPEEITVPIKLNQVEEFPASARDECALQAECTIAKVGGSSLLPYTFLTHGFSDLLGADPCVSK